MKRCPQCLFIYPDSDTNCDFDNTPLVAVDDAELEAATRPAPARKKSQRKLLVVVSAALVLIISAVTLVYYSLTHRTRSAPETVSTQPAQPNIPDSQTTPIASPSPVEVASPSPSPTAPANAKEPAQRVATAHSSTTIAPVSTSGPGMGKKLGGKPVILLTSGGKIDADEVWRTKDGVWYRRNGIVTLLKQGRVRAIVNQ